VASRSGLHPESAAAAAVTAANCQAAAARPADPDPPPAAGTDSNHDDALTEHGRPFPAPARRNNQSQPVCFRAHGAHGTTGTPLGEDQ
jgi:hypothetical protein